jgi:hypothetical protein
MQPSELRKEIQDQNEEKEHAIEFVDLLVIVPYSLPLT